MAVRRVDLVDLRALHEQFTDRLNANRQIGVRNSASLILAHRAVADLLNHPNAPAAARERALFAIDEALAVCSE